VESRQLWLTEGTIDMTIPGFSGRRDEDLLAGVEGDLERRRVRDQRIDDTETDPDTETGKARPRSALSRIAARVRAVFGR
jgi:hypothetical protein